MELKEYLDSSKAKRSELISAASRILLKSESKISRKDIRDLNDSEGAYGPTAKKFKEFEGEVESQLKKFFRPQAAANDPRPKVLNGISVNKRIKKVYSKNSMVSKRKQLVIMPKNFYYTPIKIPKQITNGKYLHLSPYVAPIATKRGINRSLTPSKLNSKTLLLQPILGGNSTLDPTLKHS